MDIRKIKKLIELLEESDLTEIEIVRRRGISSPDTWWTATSRHANTNYHENRKHLHPK